MDASFFTVSRRERWRRLQDPLRLVLDDRDYPRLLVGRLLHRLLTEDPGYRRTFERRLEQALDGELDSEFLGERLEAYEHEADALGLPERAFFEEWRTFLAGRPAALREETRRLFEAP
jgi:hypothetical protein